MWYFIGKEKRDFMFKKEITKQDGEEYFKIYCALKKHYGSQFRLHRKIGDCVYGHLGNEKIIIDFKPNVSLTVIMDASGKTYVEFLLPVLEPWMNGEKPLCRYDYQNENGKVQTVIEWEKQNPIYRLEEIKRQSMIKNSSIFHLEVYQQEKEKENFAKLKTRENG